MFGFIFVGSEGSGWQNIGYKMAVIRDFIKEIAIINLKKLTPAKLQILCRVNLFKPKLDFNYERYRKQGKENRSRTLGC